MTVFPPPAQRGRGARLLPIVLPLAVLALAAVLVHFPPEQYGFYPECPIHRYLHLDCPGCGATRALAALLRGHVAEALHLNPLITLLAPFALYWIARSYARLLRGLPVTPPQLSPRMLQVAFVVTILFGIIRNL